MGLLEQASAGALDEEERIRRHHAQIRKELKEQETKVDAVFAKYNEIAGKLSAFWKTHSEIVMYGDKAVRSVTKDNPKYAEFQKLQVVKAEAHEAWQIEANKHGRFIMTAEKVMNVLPPRYTQQA